MAPSDPSPRADPFLESLAAVCTVVAWADGAFDASEVREVAAALSESLETRYGASGPPSEEALHEIFFRAEQTVRDAGPQRALAEASTALPKAQRLHILSVAATTIAADGKVTPAEEAAFQAAAGALGLQEFADEFLAMVRDELRTAKRDETGHVLERLERMGWSEPDEAGPSRSLTNDAGCKLRIQHNAADRSLHYHVADETGVSYDFVLYAGEQLDDVLTLITNVQGDLQARTLLDHVEALMRLCPGRLFAFRDGELYRVGRGSPSASGR